MIRVARWVRVLVLLQLLRLVAGSLFELVPQEAYYIFYARHPALSYFDHPGALAWALALPARLFPPPPIAVRMVPFLFAAVTLAGVVRLARRLVPGAPGTAVLLLATTGAFSVLTVVALPDAPLVAAWTWALCFLADAFLDGRERAWLPAGLCAGLAFDSKYTAAFLFLGAAVLFLLLPRGRRALGTPWPWLGLLAAGLRDRPGVDLERAARLGVVPLPDRRTGGARARPVALEFARAPGLASSARASPAALGVGTGGRARGPTHSCAERFRRRSSSSPLSPSSPRSCSWW